MIYMGNNGFFKLLNGSLIKVKKQLERMEVKGKLPERNGKYLTCCIKMTWCNLVN